jgi:hypothetical protein
VHIFATLGSLDDDALCKNMPCVCVLGREGLIFNLTFNGTLSSSRIQKILSIFLNLRAIQYNQINSQFEP